jgi:membrane-bound lytic murein transglycosylase B
MKYKPFQLLCFLTLFLLPAHSVFADVPNNKVFNQFISRMVNYHHFDEAALRKKFKSVKIQQPILEAIAKPAEDKPWHQYREIFLTEQRIEGGVEFWRKNEKTLEAVENKYKIPAEYIVAIIGVETNYGDQLGKYRVIDALSTLAFAYPPRSRYFQKELESFLVLTRKEHINPLTPMGSYAGAMGLPQFMPSSFKNFAVDFDLDRKRDIWKSQPDAIASVGKYLAHHKWQAGGAIAFPVKASGDAYQEALDDNLKPDVTVEKLRSMQVSVPSQLKNSEMVKLLSFQQTSGQDLWVTLHNFYVITRYNNSPLYAMAVYQLSQSIADRKKSLHSPAELQK